MNDGFDITELEQYQKSLLQLAQHAIPEETKKFMKKKGKELTKLNKRTYQSKGIGEETGNLRASFKTGKVYKYDGALAVRAFNSSPHAHLLDKGYTWTPHRKVAKGQKKKQSGDEVFKPGFNFMEEAERAFRSGYYQSVDEFINDVVEKEL